MRQNLKDDNAILCKLNFAGYQLPPKTFFVNLHRNKVVNSMSRCFGSAVVRF